MKPLDPPAPVEEVSGPRRVQVRSHKKSEIFKLFISKNFRQFVFKHDDPYFELF